MTVQKVLFLHLIKLPVAFYLKISVASSDPLSKSSYLDVYIVGCTD